MRKFKIGKEYLSLSEIARRHDIAPEILQYRVSQKGMSLAIAVSRPVKQATTYAFAEKALTLRQWSRETGISIGTLTDRITFRRWPLERALTEPMMDSRQRALKRRNAKLIARIVAVFGEEVCAS